MPSRARACLFVLLSLGLALCVSLGLAAPRAQTASPLVLDDGHPLFEVWPSVRLLSDPAGSLSAAEAASRLDRFEPPTGPAGSLGPRRDVLWLHLPLQVAGGDGQWVLDIDYPAINEVQVFLQTEGQLRPLARLGSSQPFGQRPMPSRSHALLLQLAPGQHHDLLLRVQTDSAVVLPITLSKPHAFQAREQNTLLSQGVMLGLALALLCYSLAYGISLREPLFALYAALLLGSTLFLADFFGIGQMVLWTERQGLTAMLSPLSVLLAMAVGAQFVTRSMEMRHRNPRLYRGLQALSAFSAAVLVLGLLGLLSYRQAQLLATIVGPLVPLLIIPAAWQRARSGERVGRYMLIGWGAYLAGALTTAALLRGYLPANFWTLHIFQWGTAVEMLAWLRVLGLHLEAVRNEAHRSASEKLQLESLAHTDPLTGLPNRRRMQLELDAALAESGANRLLAVFLVDLDGFKAVNDGLGHEAGDELLVQAARRLKAQLRHRDIVARLGGDEFVLLVRGLAQDRDAHAVGLKLLAAFSQPFFVNGRPCRVGLTVGYALGPVDSPNGVDLLRLADAAMYAGKQAGRHQVRRGAPVLAGA